MPLTAYISIFYVNIFLCGFVQINTMPFLSVDKQVIYRLQTCQAVNCTALLVLFVRP